MSACLVPGAVPRERAFVVLRKLKPRRKEFAQSPSVRAESKLDPRASELKVLRQFPAPASAAQPLRITSLHRFSQEKAWRGRAI